MKKRKGNLLQRMLAVLLVTGMVLNAAPASVLAQEAVVEQQRVMKQ